MNTALWIIQALLAVVFLFAGGAKFVLPVEQLTAGPVAPPLMFIRFIGACEICGALGLILPGLLRIRPNLTAWAAYGLVIIMIGAVTVTIMGGDNQTALIPLVVGLFAAFVAYGRSRLAPLSDQSRSKARPSAAGF